VAGVAGAGALLSTAPPAGAHAVTGVKPSNYTSEIVGVSGGALDVQLLDLGRRIELHNPSPTDVVVLGYTGEPWLRVGARGVFENEYSYSAYQERQRRGAVNAEPPDPALAAGPPRWRRTASGRTLVWRDRRTVFEGPTPQAVRDARDQLHVVVPRWVIELRRGNAPLTVEGRITYVPPASAMPWIVVAIVAFGATIATVRSARWPWLLGQALALVIAIDAVHTFANAAVSGGSLVRQASEVLRGSPLALAAWFVGVAAIAMLRSRNDGALVLAGSSALVIGFYGGATDIATLTSSQVASALSPTAARAAVALTLGLGFGIAAAAAYLGMRSRAPRSPATVRG
jgi:hypothetical protein